MTTPAKRCLDCQVGISDRHKNALRCHSCATERLRKSSIVRALQWAKDNPKRTAEIRRARYASYKAENREQFMLYQARRRARIKGLVCTITLTDFSIPKVCPALGIPLSFEGHRDTTPSLDVINPRFGYIPGNVQVISLRANRCKSDLSFFEMRLMASALSEWAR